MAFKDYKEDVAEKLTKVVHNSQISQTSSKANILLVFPSTVKQNDFCLKLEKTRQPRHYLLCSELGQYPDSLSLSGAGDGA